MPSLIPKLLSSRSKEERLKRQDSKDDIRHLSRSARKDFKEDSKSPSLVTSPTSASKDEVCKSGIRIFRRDNSREDVGRDNANLIKDSAKGKQQEKQERTEVVGGARLRAADEQSRTRCEDGKDDANDVEGSSSRREEAIASIESDTTVLDAQPDEKADATLQDARMIDVIIAENRTHDERMREKDTMVLGNEEIDEKHLLATRESIESVTESNKGQDNDEEETRDIAEQSLDVGSDGDVTGIASERKGSLEIGYGKRPDEFQVVSEYACVLWHVGAIHAGVSACVCRGVTGVFCETRTFSIELSIYRDISFFTFTFINSI